MSATRTVSIIVRGRVQGVSYRVWTRSEARARGLRGFVRNRDDGSVEALFSGPADAVAAMETACRFGPPGARVSDMDVRERDDLAAPEGFEILRD
ncbi:MULTISPECIES: acylphosphatase [Methylobacterium]|uniref:acylphosphatase n=1 Tax=Methylobacterium longum TaxID=767694 RepID=A0ABT8ALQ8_9HYPH|nr:MULTISPECIES: acylphosphatase [Methylobacterium]MCJ2101623.1 acylphosphatase [Methylobacterium sp. E-046]MDN3570672.1 acylphosphatase [Methylobacterium longum]GJE09816.1 Acylphosphatase [Methylobacterium longum]